MGTIKFYTDATKAGLPFIEVKDEGEKDGAIMLIDTGANDNVLFGYIYRMVKDKMTTVEGDYESYSIDGTCTKMTKAKTTLTICGRDHDMVFLIREDDTAAELLAKDMGFPVYGIIGTLFMAEHEWVIDFARQEIRIPEHDISVKELRKIGRKDLQGSE